MVSRIEIEARRCGIRWTARRKLIAEVLSDSLDHPDIAQLHLRVRAHDDRISLSTVYRMVRRLSEAGIIGSVDFGDGRVRFEEAAKAHHDHLIEVSTGRIIEFSSPEIERLQHQIARELGYRLVGHRLALYGQRLRGAKKLPGAA